MLFSPDGRVLATTAGQSKFVWLWDATTGEQLEKLDVGSPGRLQGLAFSGSGQFLAAAGYSGVARLWQMGQPIKLIDELGSLHSYGEMIAFLPTTDQLIAWTFDGLRVWNHLGSAVSPTLRGSDQHIPLAGNPFANVLRVTPDRSRLLLVGSCVIVLRLPDLSSIGFHTVPDSMSADDAAMSPDGRWLVVPCGKRIHILNWDTGEWRPEPLLHSWGSRAVAFTPDGRQLLSAGADGCVQMWDTSDWREIRQFDFGIGILRVAAISPDGTMAAAGSDRGEIVVWDLDG